MDIKEYQYIQVKIKDKIVKGTSKLPGYIDWIEGFASNGLSVYASGNELHFENVSFYAPVSVQTESLYQVLLERGEDKFEITVVHRSKFKTKKEYEPQRTVYTGCVIKSMVFQMIENKLNLHCLFDFTDSVSVTFYIPNPGDTDVVQVGPLVYSVGRQKIA